MEIEPKVQQGLTAAVKRLVAQDGRAVTTDEDGREVCLYLVRDTGFACAIGQMLEPKNTEHVEFLCTYEGEVSQLLYDVDDDLVPEWLLNFYYREDGIGGEVLGIFQNFHDKSQAIGRFASLTRLQKLGVDTSDPAWQQWVDMGVHF